MILRVLLRVLLRALLRALLRELLRVLLRACPLLLQEVVKALQPAQPPALTQLQGKSFLGSQHS